MLGDKVQFEFKKPIYLVSKHHIVNSSAKSPYSMSPVVIPTLRP
jgi:hypothetical protein